MVERPVVGGMPAIKTIGIADVRDALGSGIDDFAAMAKMSVVFGLVYALAGLFILWIAIAQGLLVLAFPLVAGFTLIGPFAAVGLYEMSRHREKGLPVTWSTLLRSMRHASAGSIVFLGFALMFTFFVWLRIALLIYALIFGTAPIDIADLLDQLVTTGRGWLFLLLGNGIGAAFALMAFSLSVISFPLLLDRDADFVTAIVTSIRVVLINPVPMLLWAVIVAASLVVACAPAFLGLIIALPVLGHSTWHLYRKTVAGADS